MSGEDRDERFEQALKRKLRADAHAESQAERETGEAASDAAACPDAEILAAFHERMLIDAEMNATKEHVAGCARCQEILAMLEASDEVPVGEAENSFPLRESVLSTGAVYRDLQAVGQRRPAAPAAAATIDNARVAPDISSGRSWTWRWIVPAGAIAAGLFVWVAVHQQKYFSVTPKGNLQAAEQTAKDEWTERRMTAASPTPDVSQYSDRVAPLEKESGDAKLAKKSASSDRPLNGRGDADGIIALNKSLSRERDTSTMNNLELPAIAGALTDKKAMAAPAPATAPPPSSRTEPKQSEADARKDARISDLKVMGRNSVSGGAAPEAAASNRTAESAVKDAAKQKSSDASGESLDKPAKVQQSVTANGVVPPSVPANAASGQSPSSIAGTSQSATRQEKTNPDGSTTLTIIDETDPLPTTQVQSAATLQSSKSSRNVKAGAGTMILTPDGTVVWRLAGGGKIERSTDSGTTWTRQNTGTSRQLLAGAAPNPVICWVVGRAGTILLTTDGGGHWSKVVSPIAGDIGRVAAADAIHATIFRADFAAGVGAKFDSSKASGFTTADGGVTWRAAKE
jgi:hypothetical protein